MKKIIKFSSLIICFLLMISLTSCKKIDIALEFAEPIEMETTKMELDHWVYFPDVDKSGYLVYESNEYITFEIKDKYIDTKSKITVKATPQPEEKVVDVKLSIYDDAYHEELVTSGTVKFLIHEKNYYIEEILTEAHKKLYSKTSNSWTRNDNIVNYHYYSKTEINDVVYITEYDATYNTEEKMLYYTNRGANLYDSNGVSSSVKISLSYNPVTKVVTDLKQNKIIDITQKYDHDINLPLHLHGILSYVRILDEYFKEIRQYDLVSGLQSDDCNNLYNNPYSYLLYDNGYDKIDYGIKFFSTSEYYAGNIVLPLMYKSMPVKGLSKTKATSAKVICDTITIPAEYEFVSQAAFAGVTAEKVIVKSVNTSSYAFEESFVDEVILETDTQFEKFGLAKAENTKKIDFNYKCKSIDNWSFYHCPALEEVNLRGVETIGRECFYDCGNITTLILSNDLKVIAARGLSSLNNLKTITFLGTMAEWNAIDKATSKWGLDDWNYNTAIEKIVCTDGTITL